MSQFTKPFDKGELVAALQSKGMPVAEDVVQAVAETVLDWTAAGCALHENPLVKLAGTAVQAGKPAIMAQLDKIDGVIGQ